jgi:excinuclease UvrABC ATPase subunit
MRVSSYGLERPDVDKIDGLSPVIAIEQKNLLAIVMF